MRGESGYSTWRVRVVVTVTGLSLVAAACTPSADSSEDPATSTREATTTVAAPASTATPVPELTTTTEPSPAEYPPGVVWKQTIVSDTDDRLANATELTPAGWMVTTNSTDRALTTPAIHISMNGREWTRVDLPTTSSGTTVRDVVFGPAGYVAIGFAGTKCTSSCNNGNGIVWTSPDAETWELFEPSGLTGPNKVIPQEIRVIDDRYVMVGRDEQDGVDQVFKVWTSADGTTWEVTAVLDDPEWGMNLYRGFTQWDGGYVITGSRTVCSKRTYHPLAGWVHAIPGQESKAWSSPDGMVWDEIDLAGLGLIEPQDDDTCDINDWASDEAIAAANGRFESIGGRLFWTLGTGAISEIDRTTGEWGPTTRTVPDAVSNADTNAGTVEDDLGFVAVGLSGISADRVTIAMARSSDLARWEDWSPDTTTFDPFDESAITIKPTFVSTNGSQILVVYQTATNAFAQRGPITALVSDVAPIP